MSYQWKFEDGAWSAPVGDGTTEVEIFEDDLDTIPPMVVNALRRTAFGIVAA